MLTPKEKFELANCLQELQSNCDTAESPPSKEPANL